MSLGGYGWVLAKRYINDAIEEKKMIISTGNPIISLIVGVVSIANELLRSSTSLSTRFIW